MKFKKKIHRESIKNLDYFSISVCHPCVGQCESSLYRSNFIECLRRNGLFLASPGDINWGVCMFLVDVGLILASACKKLGHRSFHEFFIHIGPTLIRPKLGHVVQAAFTFKKDLTTALGLAQQIINLKNRMILCYLLKSKC